MIRQAFANEPRVKVQVYNCLTVDFAQQVNAGYILRGLRTVADFEYERSIADANNKLSGIETVILFTEASYAFISSTTVRDLIAYGKSIQTLLPPNVHI